MRLDYLPIPVAEAARRKGYDQVPVAVLLKDPSEHPGGLLSERGSGDGLRLEPGDRHAEMTFKFKVQVVEGVIENLRQPSTDCRLADTRYPGDEDLLPAGGDGRLHRHRPASHPR